MKKRTGFTLAEVLITLGIIGVVAAMTIPTLLQNTNSAKFSAQFKKDISTLSQAALMGLAQYDTDYGVTTDACSSNNAQNVNLTGTSSAYEVSFCGLLNSTLSGATYYGKVSDNKLKNKNGDAYGWKGTQYALTGDSALSKMIIYGLADGSIFGFPADAKECALAEGESLSTAIKAKKDAEYNTDGTLKSAAEDAGHLNKCVGFIDVNGTNPPNKEISCATTTDNGLATETTCIAQTGSAMGDIFPVVFHDGIVQPASVAAKSILAGGKK